MSKYEDWSDAQLEMQLRVVQKLAEKYNTKCISIEEADLRREVLKRKYVKNGKVRVQERMQE